MASTGDAIKKDFLLILKSGAQPETIEYIESAAERCCFKMKVLADVASSTSSKNDVTSAYFGYYQNVTNVVLSLWKDDVDTGVVLGTYGTLYAYGFHEDDGKKYIGYQINWKAILTEPTLGEGEYFVRATKTMLTGGTQTEDSFTWCLQQFTNARAEGTVKIEFTHTGIIGDYLLDDEQKSFKDLDWYNSIRLEGQVYGEKSEFEIEEIQYNSGTKIDSKVDQDPIYELILHPIPNFLHRYMKIEALLADEILITDYNTDNPLKPIVQKAVLFKGNYEPQWKGRNPNASVIIQLNQKINNLRKKFS